MPSVATYFCFVSTSTSPIPTPISTGHLTLQHLAVTRVMTAWTVMTGLSFDLEWRCFTIPFHRWRLLLTRCTLTLVLTLHSTTAPFQETCLCILSRKQIISSCILGKRPRISSRFPPHFFFFVFFWGPFGVWRLLSNLTYRFLWWHLGFHTVNEVPSHQDLTFLDPSPSFFSTPSTRWLDELVKYFWVA